MAAPPLVVPELQNLTVIFDPLPSLPIRQSVMKAFLQSDIESTLPHLLALPLSPAPRLDVAAAP